METDEFFTIKEKDLLFSLYRKLLQLSGETLQKGDCKKLKTHLVNTIQNNRIQRDIFGLNPVIKDMQTAVIVAEEIGMKRASILGLMLHDSVRCGTCTALEVEQIYGEDVAGIIRGLIRVNELYSKSPTIESENFRNLLLTFAEDMRVILIMIADRVNIMRQIKDCKNDEARRQVANEAAYLYAPLAHKLGLYKLKSELEDLSLKYTEKEVYYHIKEKLNETKASRDKYIAAFIAPVQKKLEEAGLKFHIKGRTKSIHSIYQKMKKQKCPFEGVYDLFAIRVILDSCLEKEKLECWQAYSIVTDMYQPNPKRLRDWLSVPKSNGYESLHITVMGPEGKWVEVQIRTERMDEIAEKGLAAHWRYKGIKGETGLDEWLTSVREALENADNDSMKVMDQFKMDLYEDEVFVFTPKGEIKTMPAGCTALDFAFQIHTFLGSHCIGAKVNHKLVPLSHKLQSGDQVEILTSNSQHVQPSWINFASTAKAKAKIQAILRREAREIQKQGEEILSEFLSKHSLEINSSVIDKLCEFHEVQKPDELFKAIGKKNIILSDKDIDEINGKRKQNSAVTWRKFVPFLGKEKKKGNENKKPNYFIVKEGFNRKKPIYITDDNINQFIFPDCCHPIPGDDALGFIDGKNRIEIHKRSCPVAAKLKSGYGNRILDAKWDMHKKLLFDAVIEIKGIDRIGMLNEVTQVISDELNVNIHRVTLSCEEGIFDGTLELRIHDRDDVRTIMGKLKKVEGLQEIKQIL